MHIGERFIANDGDGRPTASLGPVVHNLLPQLKNVHTTFECIYLQKINQLDWTNITKHNYFGKSSLIDRFIKCIERQHNFEKILDSNVLLGLFDK